MIYIPAITLPEKVDKDRWWFAFRKGKLLVKINGDRADIPRDGDFEKQPLKLERQLYLGSLDGVPCFSALLHDGTDVPDGMQFKGLRGLFGLLEEEIFGLAGRSFQLLNWDWSHQYCGRCGSRTVDRTQERAKECPDCGLISYPSISPAIIVAVRKGSRILLAHSTRHRSGWYSVLAGFVEPGETLEACVRREVKEEVGLEVKNIRYFGSQPWPFPNSLMVGFTAEYGGGTIVLDDDEILDARWFAADNLPPIPGQYTIARHLIDHFVSAFKSKPA